MTEDQKNQELLSVKRLVKNGDHAGALSLLLHLAHWQDDFTLQHRYSRVLKSFPSSSLSLTPIRIAIAAGGTVNHFADVFRFWMAMEGFDAEIFLAPFNTIEPSLLDPSGSLYDFSPDIIWIFTGYRDVPVPEQYGLDEDSTETSVERAVARFSTLWDAVRRNSSAYIIQNNADLPLDRPFGHFEGNAIWGRCNWMRRFNLRLAEATAEGVTIFDIDHISSMIGKRHWFDERYWFHSKHPFSLEGLGAVAFQGARLVRGLKGKAWKCLVLDLDNTLWGGVIGDDGLEGIRIGSGAEGEAFVAFQEYLVRLKTRGIILTVCSKNEKENAILPFLNHPDMRLRLEDISVFIANWNNKADNIREIAATLEIGLDSLVFIDDNPAERKLVKDLLPMVAVPELPSDPAGYVRAIDQQGYFETISFSAEDGKRSEMYRGNAERKKVRQNYTDLSAFLMDLDMKAVCREFDLPHLPRVVQLINKSNQFHLTSTRYTEADIKEMMKDDQTIGRFFKLGDRFGDNGLICVVIARVVRQELSIDTWVMSCRVLSRGMEEFVHNDLVAVARQRNVSRIRGRYLPTKKNGLVREHYRKLGYTLVEEQNGMTEWVLDLDSSGEFKKVYIERVDSY